MGKEKGLPENWRERVAGKKVVLYLTSLSNMLSGGMKHIEKIERVIETFRQQEEVVLWWRPHPLEIATLESMRPELMAKYKEVRTQYQNEAWGILDTSSDLHRAIAVSDAYYGDWSSVIQLYKATGKPILVENDNMLNPNKAIQLSVQDFIVLNNTMWFISATMNILFAMDMETFEIVEAIKIPYGNIFEKYMSYHIANVENYIVLIPGRGKCFVRFSLDDRTFEKIDIGEKSNSTKFGAYGVHNEYIYAFPAYESRVIKYDALRNRIVSEKQIKNRNDGLFLGENVYVDEEDIYAVESETNCIYKYNMEKDTFKVIHLEEADLKLGGIIKANDYFVLTLMGSDELILWNEQEGIITRINEFPQEFVRGNRHYSDMVVAGDKVLLFPSTANMILQIDVKSLNVKPFFKEEETNKCDKIPYFPCAKLYGEKIYAFNNKKNEWLIIEMNANKIEVQDVKMGERIVDDIWENSLFNTLDDVSDNNDNGFYEKEDGEFYSIDNFIKNLIVYEPGIKEKKKNERRSYGECIHEKVMQ